LEASGGGEKKKSKREKKSNEYVRKGDFNLGTWTKRQEINSNVKDVEFGQPDDGEC